VKLCFDGFGREIFSRPLLLARGGILLLASLLLPVLAGACESEPAIELFKQKQGRQLQVAFVVSSSCQVTLAYRQAFEKQSASGQTNIAQQGVLELMPGVPATTSFVNFSDSHPVQLRASIVLFRDKKRIAEREITIGL